MKIRKGDTVRVIAGKDLGKEGTVIRAIPERDRVIVDGGINVSKRHQRATSATSQGGIIDKEMPIHISNVAIVCGKCGPTRIGFKIEGAKKRRVCRKCGGDL
ncbi:MAG: 50S ribosomal protein L24 [Actinomycetes bacterium]